MNFVRFLRDRLVYIAIYAGLGLLTVTVIQLDLQVSGARLQRSNLLYLGLLGLAGLLLWLYVDNRRQAAFLRHLESIDPAAPLDDLGLLPAPASREQAVFARAWSSLYARLRAALTEEQQRGRENVALLSQWAHHMKTPVAVIDLELQKAAREPLPSILASVAEENQRLGHSLQMLMGQIRLADFAADFQVERVDLPALVRALVNDQKRAFIAHRVYPRVEVPADLPPGAFTVASDAKWLRFVLEQVVANAIKYAARPEGDGQVRLRCRLEGGQVLLEVEDNGIGIAPEDLGRVFQPFFTGANGRALPQSTGMGLYLAQQACRRLGHRLQIASKRCEFTRVTISFAPTQTLFEGLSASLTER
jgi:two-component system, OmpR family, sensor histidine kinase YxdK